MEIRVFIIFLNNSSFYKVMKIPAYLEFELKHVFEKIITMENKDNDQKRFRFLSEFIMVCLSSWEKFHEIMDKKDLELWNFSSDHDFEFYNQLRRTFYKDNSFTSQDLVNALLLIEGRKRRDNLGGRKSRKEEILFLLKFGYSNLDLFRSNSHIINNLNENFKKSTIYEVLRENVL